MAPLADPRPTIIIVRYARERSIDRLRPIYGKETMLCCHRIITQLAYVASSLSSHAGRRGELESFAARSRRRTDGRTDGRGAPDANNLNQHHLISPKLMIVRCSSVCSLPLVRGHHLHQMIISVGRDWSCRRVREQPTYQGYPCRW